jgi:TonB family protein
MWSLFRIHAIAFFLLIVSVSNVLITAQTEPLRLPQRSSETRRQIPEASIPCTSDEATWWNDLRAAGEAVRVNGGSKERKQFLELLQEGQKKAYQPPVPDRAAVVLRMSEPKYTDEARHEKINGVVPLQVEFLSDGTVGKVVLLGGLGFGLDQAAMDAARQTTFLPAIKDRKFVRDSRQMKMSFYIY